MRQKTIASPEVQWARTVEEWLRKDYVQESDRYFEDGCPMLAQVVRPHKFAVVGDVYLVSSTTGAGRWGLTGYTSKGRSFQRYWFNLEFSGDPWEKG